jgi:hypothetical protein
MSAADPAPELLSRERINELRNALNPKWEGYQMCDQAALAVELAAKLAAAEQVGAALVVQNGQLERRAIRAEAKLVAAQEAIATTLASAAGTLQFLREGGIKASTADGIAGAIEAILEPLTALPIPAAKPEGE